MKSLLRLGLILAGAWVISYGVDGVTINSAPKYFTMEEVERNGVGGARYVVVTGAVSMGDHIAVQTYRTTEPSKKYTTGAVIPLYSPGRLASSASVAPPPTSILYKLDGNAGCLADNSCIKPGSVEVRGVVRRTSVWGVNAMSYTDSYPHAPNFIFVTQGLPLPRPIYLLLALAGGVLLVLAFLPDRHFDKYVTGRRR